MSQLTLTLIQLGFLALLWFMVLSVASVRCGSKDFTCSPAGATPGRGEDRRDSLHDRVCLVRSMITLC